MDLLENRRYRQLGSTQDIETNARLIFTSNIDIDAPDSLLTEDMKNRLRHRILNIPRLSSLPREIRNAEISEFIKFWCEKEQAVIDSRAWEMLLHLDFSRGSFRMLSGLLHKAKWMMEKEYGINTSESGTRSPVFISMDFIEMAKEKLDLGKKAKVCADVSAGSGSVRKELAWITAVWISYECKQNKTYDLILGSGRKTKNGLTLGTIGSPKFKEILAEFMRAFESRSEDAWNFFFKPQAAALLNSEKDLVQYIDSLGVTDTGKNANTIFDFDKIEKKYKLSKEQWLKERAGHLSQIKMLNDPQKVKKKFLEVMGKLK